jgi:hypothetical protein
VITSFIIHYSGGRLTPHSLLDLTHAAEITPAGSRQDYTQFFVWLLRARLGRAAEANRELAAYMNPERQLSQEPWVVEVGAFLLGNVTEDDLLTAAASPDAFFAFFALFCAIPSVARLLLNRALLVRGPLRDLRWSRQLRHIPTSTQRFNQGDSAGHL